MLMFRVGKVGRSRGLARRLACRWMYGLFAAVALLLPSCDRSPRHAGTASSQKYVALRLKRVDAFSSGRVPHNGTQGSNYPRILPGRIIMKTLISALAIAAILASSAVAKTQRTKGAHIQPNGSVAQVNSAVTSS